VCERICACMYAKILQLSRTLLCELRQLVAGLPESSFVQQIKPVIPYVEEFKERRYFWNEGGIYHHLVHFKMKTVVFGYFKILSKP